MSDKVLVKKMYTHATETRRLAQLSCLNDWYDSKITARQCIEKILDLEQIIPYDPQIIKDHFEEDGEDTNG